MDEIALEPRHRETVRRILREHVPEAEVRVFGSRVTGAAAKFSDLDLVVVARERLDWRRLGRLSTAMVESDLPIRVDVLDWHAISPAFRRLIEGQCVVLQPASVGTPRVPGPTEGATEPVG